MALKLGKGVGTDRDVNKRHIIVLSERRCQDFAGSERSTA